MMEATMLISSDIEKTEQHISMIRTMVVNGYWI